jgi:hypothetical protein
LVHRRGGVPATGDRRPATGDRRPATGDRRPATGDRRVSDDLKKRIYHTAPHRIESPTRRFLKNFQLTGNFLRRKTRTFKKRIKSVADETKIIKPCTAKYPQSNCQSNADIVYFNILQYSMN